jgi:hypothetical protein
VRSTKCQTDVNLCAPSSVTLLLCAHILKNGLLHQLYLCLSDLSVVRYYGMTPDGLQCLHIVWYATIRFDHQVHLSMMYVSEAHTLNMVFVPVCRLAAGCSGGFINMWSSCFQADSITESTHSLGSSGSLPGPGTPMQSGHLLLSAHSSKSLPQLPPEPPASDDTGSGCESGSGDDSSGLGLDAVMADSPRAGHSSAMYGSQHGEPDCQLIGHDWKLWAHKHVLKSECARLSSSCTDSAMHPRQSSNLQYSSPQCD